MELEVLDLKSGETRSRRIGRSAGSGLRNPELLERVHWLEDKK